VVRLAIFLVIFGVTSILYAVDTPKDIVRYRSPECTTHRVSNLSDSEVKFDSLIHICGEEITAQSINKSIEQYTVYRESNQNREDQWEERVARADLKAQKTMAFWTKLIGLFTFLALCVSLYGIRLLIKNLDTGNKTANAAENAERAHIFMTFEHGRVDDNTFFFKPFIFNYGRSPATNVAVSVKCLEYSTDKHSRYIYGCSNKIIGAIEKPTFLEEWFPCEEGRGTVYGFEDSDVSDMVVDFALNGFNRKYITSVEYKDIFRRPRSIIYEHKVIFDEVYPLTIDLAQKLAKKDPDRFRKERQDTETWLAGMRIVETSVKSDSDKS